MAIKRINPYAKAYSFGMEGNAALADMAPPVRRHAENPLRRPAAGYRLMAPRWLCVAVLAAVGLSMLAVVVVMRRERTELANSLALHTAHIADAAARLEALELQIAQASDDLRIHTGAANRLGMRQPTDEQIVYLPRAQAEPEPVADERQQEMRGQTQLMQSMGGL